MNNEVLSLQGLSQIGSPEVSLYSRGHKKHHKSGSTSNHNYFSLICGFFGR